MSAGHTGADKHPQHAEDRIVRGERTGDSESERPEYREEITLRVQAWYMCQALKLTFGHCTKNQHFFLPYRSAIIPQAKAPKSIPMKTIVVSTAFALSVKLNSHANAGEMNPIIMISIASATQRTLRTKNSFTWNLPKPNWLMHSPRVISFSTSSSFCLLTLLWFIRNVELFRAISSQSQIIIKRRQYGAPKYR